MTDPQAIAARLSEALEQMEVRALAAEQRAADAEHRLHAFRQGRAARARALADFVKSRAPELWADYAALSVNGSIYSDALTIEPTYEREMNILRHRAEDAEAKLTALLAVRSILQEQENEG